MLLDERDVPVRDSGELASILQVSGFGSLPMVRDHRRALSLAPASHVRVKKRLPLTQVLFANAVQSLCSTVLLSSSRQMRSILVTSPLPGQGKTVTACHLAAANARKQRRTLLIDCDLRSPSVHFHYGIDQIGGLNEVLRGSAHWRDVRFHSVGIPGLDILAAGSPTSEGPNLLCRELPKILVEATKEYELVVIDCPPLLAFAEPLEIALATDGVLLLAVAGETGFRLVRHCVAMLRQIGVHNIGLVLNKATSANSNYDYYSKYARYYKRYGSR